MSGWLLWITEDLDLVSDCMDVELRLHGERIVTTHANRQRRLRYLLNLARVALDRHWENGAVQRPLTDAEQNLPGISTSQLNRTAGEHDFIYFPERLEDVAVYKRREAKTQRGHFSEMDSPGHSHQLIPGSQRLLGVSKNHLSCRGDSDAIATPIKDGKLDLILKVSICLLSDGWARKRRSAARVKFEVSATATMYFRSRNSRESDIAVALPWLWSTP
jgi:hypothetical protein